METPRPTLDVDNLDSPPSLQKRRTAVLVKAKGKQKPSSSAVMNKYRKRQDKLLDEPDVDPYPYVPTYLFYCLDSPTVE